MNFQNNMITEIKQSNNIFNKRADKTILNYEIVINAGRHEGGY